MRQYEHGGDIYNVQLIIDNVQLCANVKNSEIIDFSVNTNPLGMPAEVRAAIVARADEFSRYPDPYCRELRAAVAAYEGVPDSAVLCGNGAADLIYRLCYGAKPRKAVVCAPTFSEYERALLQAGGEVIHYNLKPENGFSVTADLENALVTDVDFLFLCNPNNPTGRLIPENVLERILKRASLNNTKIVVDECFLDFTDGVSCKRFLGEVQGLSVLKAFTKTFALAGLRLGYLLTFDRELLEKTAAAGQCWSVSVPAQIAGTAALKCKNWLEKTRRLIGAERGFLSAGLRKLGLEVFESGANFLLFRCETPLYEPLLKKGILIRPCGNFRGLDGAYYRAGVRTRDENTLLLQAIGEIITNSFPQ